jgi:molybdate transport system ATP-binding protein
MRFGETKMTHLNIQKELRGTDGAINLDINHKLEADKLTVLFGKSGAGKSTILKMIAGLLEPTNGQIIINGEIWFDKAKKISINRYRCSYLKCVTKQKEIHIYKC